MSNLLKSLLHKIYFYVYKKTLSPKVLTVRYKNRNLYISNTVDITHMEKVNWGNNVFIWHFTILDSFNGITIGNDCQIGTRVSIFTHSSHNSIRYYNSSYQNISFEYHKGRVKGSVDIGDNTFIGANAVIMPNTKIGRGCIVSSFSYVQGEFEDFSIISGNPAKKVGDVRKIDYRFLKKNPDLVDSYIKYYGFHSLDDIKNSDIKIK